MTILLQRNLYRKCILTANASAANVIPQRARKPFAADFPHKLKTTEFTEFHRVENICDFYVFPLRSSVTSVVIFLAGAEMLPLGANLFRGCLLAGDEALAGASCQTMLAEPAG